MRFRNLILLMAGILMFSGCSTNKKGDKPIISVTIEPLRYFTEAITGDKFEINSMVPKGSSPETYDPTPQQLVALSNSVAYVRIGYIGFELSWIDKIKENNPNLLFFDTSVGVDLIQAESHWHGDHEHKGGIEPHIWNSTVNAKVIAQNILKAVQTIDPDNSEYYKENYTLLLESIKETESKIDAILVNDKIQKGFMIYHPALSYFARDYGLEQISIEEEGKEPTPSHLKGLINKALDQNIHTIFIQPEFDKKNAEVIAKQTNSQIVSIYPLAYEWHEEMIKIAQALVN